MPLEIAFSIAQGLYSKTKLWSQFKIKSQDKEMSEAMGFNMQIAFCRIIFFDGIYIG